MKTTKRIAVAGLACTLAFSSLAVQPLNTQAAAKKATAIKLNTTSEKLYVGQTITLKVKKVTPAKASKAVIWKTSNKKVATVTTKGKVTAKKKGTATITAVSKGNKKVKAVCKITVIKKETSAKKDIVYSGSYKNTTWTIDKKGLLVVKGTGDMNPSDWLYHDNDIKSAKIEVTGATSLEKLFYSCRNLTNVDLSKLDTSKVTNMSSMFEFCSGLTTLDVSKFNTSKVTNMKWMFNGCGGLKKLDVGKFNTSKVTNMDSMFFSCGELTSLDLSSFDISQVNQCSSFFANCDKLETISTPKKSAEKVMELPGDVTWIGSDGQNYTKVPANATESITLTKYK